MCGIREISSSAASIFKDINATRTSVSGISSIIRSAQLHYSFTLPVKLLATISTIEDFVFATRIFQSAEYLLSGRLFGDIAARPLGALANSCFLFARIGTTAKWLAAQNLIDLGAVASFVGNIPVIGQTLTALMAKPIREILFLAGVGALALQRLISFVTDPAHFMHKLADLASLAAEAGILSCVVFGGASALILQLGVAAAVSGIAEFLLRP